MIKPTILIGSPVQQKPVTLKLFLESLQRLQHPEFDVDYIFIDDNIDPESSYLLKDFAEKIGRTEIIEPSQAVEDQFERDEYTHYWKESIIWKVAEMKNDILARVRDGHYTHVFFADSDLLFHPRTLYQLWHANREIISALFWTSWQPGTLEMPQVWLHGEYEQHPLARHVEQSDEQLQIQRERFFASLRTPGIYEVGGLGACTLISREAVLAGVSFKEIKNLHYWGEDRHFCIRAASLGINLYVETTYPAYHIYREADLAGVDGYLESTLQDKPFKEAEPANNDNYSKARKLQSYGYNSLAMEEFKSVYKDKSGTESEQVHAVLELDAYYGRSGEFERGRELLLEALETLKYAELFCRIGAKCMDSENWKEAAAWYRAAIAISRPASWQSSVDPACWTWKPYIQLCVCCVQLGDLLRAYEYNEEGLKYDPANSSMLSNREYLRNSLKLTQS